VAIENLDLGERMDDFETIVWLLGKWVAEQIKLLQEGEALQEQQKVVKVSKLVISDEKRVQELKLADTFNASESVVLTVDLLNSEVGRNVV